MTLREVQKKLATLPGIPGRLEAIVNNFGIHLFVDFAHTDEALKKILQLLRQVGAQKIITIFGCGGDRDRGKRPEMARVVEAFSNDVIITSDNPRSEDPLVICQQVAEGITRPETCILEVDRRLAIEKGISLAKPGDIVLIAGRGHEPFQKIGGRLIPFDDREVAKEICNLSKEMVE